MRFVHLHNHFWGSYSDSVLSIPEGLERAATLGYRAMAITDHGELAFAPQFYHSCREGGLNPLLGCECHFVRDARDHILRGDGSRNHLILIAKDMGGYRNLVRLASDAWLNNCFKGSRGLVDWALLEKYHEGIVCLSGCYYGSFPLTLIREGREAGERELRRYLDLFGDDFHPEMSNLGFPEQEISNAAIIELAPGYGLRPVVTNDVHYPYPEDWLAHDIIAKSRFGTVSDFSVVTRSIWLKSVGEMRGLGFDARYLANTVGVAEKCLVQFPPGFVSPPVLNASPEEDVRLLGAMCGDALERRSGSRDKNRWHGQVKKELRTIEKSGLAGYLLLLAGLVKNIQKAGSHAPVTRGRATDSAVMYLLGLSKEVPRLDSLPGADSFAHLVISCPHPEEAIGDLMRTMGDERVCRTAEMVPIRGADALRFTAEVIGVPADLRERGLREVKPDGTVEENISSSTALAELCRTRPDLLRWAARIEGIPRASRPSRRCLALSDEPITQLIPAKRVGDVLCSQYDCANARLAGFLTVEIMGN